VHAFLIVSYIHTVWQRSHLSNNRELASKLLVNHESEDSHHSSTAVVQLDGTLGELGLFVKAVPAEVEGSVAEVSNELSLSGDILHHSELKSSNEGDNLGEASSRDGIRSGDGGPAVGEGIEGVSGVVNVSGKVDSGTGNDVSKESKLSNTSVLDLDVTEAVEALLISIIEESKGVEESKRGLGTELRLEGVECSGGLSGLGGREGGGRAEEGSEDSELHCVGVDVRRNRKLDLCDLWSCNECFKIKLEVYLSLLHFL